MGCWTPTSMKIIRRLVEMTPPGTKRVLEIGAGSGRLIRALLKSGRIDEQGTIGAIELNPRFCRFMRETIKDSRVQIRQASAANLLELRDDIFGKGQKIDGVYSSIPRKILERFGIIEQVRQITDAFRGYIYLDMSDLLLEHFDSVACERKKNHWCSWWPYTIHEATSDVTPARR